MAATATNGLHRPRRRPRVADSPLHDGSKPSSRSIEDHLASFSTTAARFHLHLSLSSRYAVLHKLAEADADADAEAEGEENPAWSPAESLATRTTMVPVEWQERRWQQQQWPRRPSPACSAAWSLPARRSAPNAGVGGRRRRRRRPQRRCGGESWWCR